MNSRLLMHIPAKVTAALETLSAIDPGIERDAKLEARIDAAFSAMRDRRASDEQSRESFDLFYRLVLARSQVAQVTIELERRKR